MTPKMPTRVSNIIERSNFLTTSLRIKKASTTTMIGDRFYTTDMIVSGMNLVTE